MASRPVNSPHILPPQQKRSRAALSKILRAAEQLLRRKGIDGFSMAGVAKVAGLPVGNIYRRFRGKDELLLAIKEDMVRRIETAIISHLADKKFSSIENFVHSFTEASIHAISIDEKLNRVLLGRNWAGHKYIDEIEAAGHMRVF